MTRRFTGIHMAAILVGFFAVVIGVNMVMAVLASRTFGGTVVDNSYVASQQFNNWLAQARRQQGSGLDATFALDGSRRLVITIAAGQAKAGAVPMGYAEHPLGRAADTPLRFMEMSHGHYRSTTAIPSGRWAVHLSMATAEGEARWLEQVG
jgi:nitrogen fixation protein FixH